MKQTNLFVDAVYIEKRGAFSLHLIFTEGKLCENILSHIISINNSENFSYSRAKSFLMLLISGSIFWP
jgi:hypothetical protein